MPRVYTERERRAYVCLHQSHEVPLRVFALADDPEPRCPTHGKMKRQVNLKPKPKVKR